MRKLREQGQRNRYLTPEEEERLLAAFTGRREHLKPIALAALHTGMRRGEILSLRWASVDFNRKRLPGGRWTSGSIYVETSKSGKPRTVPMNETVRGELLALRQADPGAEYVFGNPKTGSYVHDIKRAFTGACRDAKVDDFRFHDLRHTAATRMADAGVHPAAIREILGHASLRMTGVYTHATPQMLHEAVGALSGPTGGSLHQISTKQQKAREDESRADALTA